MATGASEALDIVVVVLSVLACVLISYIAQKRDKKDQQTVDKFMLGDRKMALIPVAFSSFATLFTGNVITSTIGESFANGMQIFLITTLYFLSQIPVAYLIIPIFHNMKYDSVYEYIERRFDRSMRLLFAASFLIVNLAANGIFLYVPAICLSTVTDIPYWITLTVSGLVCTFYCIMGGLKAVIWTDVFQSGLAFVSLIIVTIFAYNEVGGIKNAWTTTFDGQMLQHFKITEDLNNTYSVWNIVAGSIAMYFYQAFSSQALSQRILCVKDYKTAKESLLLSCALGVIMTFIVFLAGVAVFAYLSKCNPWEQPNSLVRLPDQLYVYVSSKLFNGIPGVLGLILAGIISAALSSISSVLNALSSSVLQDFIIPVTPSLKMQERKSVLICQILIGLFGVLTIAIALAVPLIGGVISVFIFFNSAIKGPLGGILTMAFFCRKTSTKACKIALCLSLMLSCWTTLGSHFDFPHKYQFVHKEGHECTDAFETANNLSSAVPAGKLRNSTHSESDIRKPSLFIYGINVFWFPLLNAAISFLLGISLSFFFGDGTEPDIRLLSPIVLSAQEKREIIKMKKQDTDCFLLKDVTRHQVI